MLSVHNTRWTPEEETIAVEVLKKIALCFKKIPPSNHPLTSMVYEAWATASTLISVELVLLQEDRIFLLKRPGKEERPEEPDNYINKLHCPGVAVVPYESLEGAIQRLFRDELSGVEIGGLEICGNVNFHLPPRAPYLGLIHVAHVLRAPLNTQGKFYPIKSVLKNSEVMDAHREIIIPQALEFLNRQ